MNAAHFVNLIDAYDGKRCQHTWRDITVCIGRGADSDFRAFDQLCKYRRHDDSGDERHIPTRDIETDSLDGVKSLSYDTALGIFRLPVFRQRLFMKVFDQRDRFADGLAVGSTEAFNRSFEVFGRNPHRLGGELRLIKFISVFKDCMVTAFTHVGKDACHYICQIARNDCLLAKSA